MKQHTYSLGLVGSGYSIREYGILRILDGQVLLCGTHLATFAREFDGQWVELAICTPNPPDPTPMDPLIAPMVKRLQDRGIVTVSSCQGHIDPDIWWRHPFVTCFGRPDVPVAPTWAITEVGLNLWNLHARGIAENTEELAVLQSLIPDEMAVLG